MLSILKDSSHLSVELDREHRILYRILEVQPANLRWCSCWLGGPSSRLCHSSPDYWVLPSIRHLTSAWHLVCDLLASAPAHLGQVQCEQALTRVSVVTRPLVYTSKTDSMYPKVLLLTEIYDYIVCIWRSKRKFSPRQFETNIWL